MNERTEDLARQVDACYIPRYDMWQMDTESLEKFVALIVKKCAMVGNYAYDGGEYPGAMIKEYFGVE